MRDLLEQLRSCLLQLQALRPMTGREAIAMGHADARLQEAILWLETAAPKARAETE